MNHNHKAASCGGEKAAGNSLHTIAEDILFQKLAHITTILREPGTAKSRLYEDVNAIVERCLFRIALERSQNVKSRAADYLGINRNTFQKKMVKLGIEE
ncbi:MAG TPA: helix-turn-helix domain-containing protein [Syntrophales bacterium]|jgi:DNA-binding protein Fis|nr:helix-turn-helix domain-containing protein [Syntrophales bacterium]HON22320.1 helix-turn-helix domain-containing protein [Syntrophales bacterium]HOU76765.1 helix-turn-helix domain-containing protein [Syntrophales bacterium]HPC31888.1 helix-turn-helix domain-containing protein [Syntrophales bacterium]HQG33550.1 helix-turn-helix domain-containing protein [Syntrophales bacterium]